MHKKKILPRKTISFIILFMRQLLRASLFAIRTLSALCAICTLLFAALTLLVALLFAATLSAALILCLSFALAAALLCALCLLFLCLLIVVTA